MSGHRETTVRLAPAMTSTLRSAMKPLMLQAVWTATWRLPVRCAVTFAMSVSVPAPTEISSRSRADFGHRALDGLLVGAHRAGAELDHRAAELLGEPVHDRPGRRAVGPAVADDHRRRRARPGAGVGDRAVQNRCADADVDVGQVVVAPLAEIGEDGVRFGNGCGHDGLANADSTASNAAQVAAVRVGVLPLRGGVGFDGIRIQLHGNRCRGEVGEHSRPDSCDHRRADGGGLLGQDPAHRPAEHIGLDRRPQVVARTAADDPDLAVAEAKRVEPVDDVAQRVCASFEHCARGMRRRVVHCEAEECAAHRVVPPRRGRPGQRRQEQHPVAGRRRFPCPA